MSFEAKNEHTPLFPKHPRTSETHGVDPAPVSVDVSRAVPETVIEPVKCSLRNRSGGVKTEYSAEVFAPLVAIDIISILGGLFGFRLFRRGGKMLDAQAKAEAHGLDMGGVIYGLIQKMSGVILMGGSSLIVAGTAAQVGHFGLGSISGFAPAVAGSMVEAIAAAAIPWLLTIGALAVVATLGIYLLKRAVYGPEEPYFPEPDMERQRGKGRRKRKKIKRG